MTNCPDVFCQCDLRKLAIKRYIVQPCSSEVTLAAADNQQIQDNRLQIQFEESNTSL